MFSRYKKLSNEYKSGLHEMLLLPSSLKAGGGEILGNPTNVPPTKIDIEVSRVSSMRHVE